MLATLLALVKRIHKIIYTATGVKKRSLTNDDINGIRYIYGSN